ncbi:hypothetical protein [Pseudoalteromonas sp.]|uniref:hypothetical protein n=1 Tax=Pseudoalteromonas sp. TaxID=53249 RepID=UPI00356365A5
MTSSEQLKESCRNFEKLFQLYTTKSQWHLAYPILVKSATQFEEVFNQNQHLMIADLSHYDSNFDYAINLLRKQCIIICLLAKLAGLNRIACVQLLQSAIVQIITVRNEINCAGLGKPLTLKQRKTFQIRFIQCYAFLKSHISKLPLIQAELINLVKKRATYTQSYSIVKLSFIVAKQMTHSAASRRRSLRSSISKVYLKLTHQYEKSLLSLLGKIFKTPLPGERIKHDDNIVLVLGLITDNKLLCYNEVENTYLELNSSLKVLHHQFQYGNTKNEFNYLWDNLPDLHAVASPPFINEYFTREDLLLIKEAAYQSVGKLINELNKNPNAQMLILNLTNRFSNKKISDLRHAIALLGVEQLPDLLENQQLLQRLHSLGKPNWQSVSSRVELLVCFIESYKGADIHFPCQKVINYALKFIAFIFKVYPHGVILPLNTPLPNQAIQHLTTTVNFYNLHSMDLPQQIKSNPFYELTQPQFNLSIASPIHSACFLHLVLFNCVYLGKQLTQLSSYEKQQLIFAQQKLGIENLDKYLTKLLDFSPVNPLF